MGQGKEARDRGNRKGNEEKGSTNRQEQGRDVGRRARDKVQSQGQTLDHIDWMEHGTEDAYDAYGIKSEANSATGTRTRVARVRAEYPSKLDYSGC